MLQDIRCICFPVVASDLDTSGHFKLSFSGTKLPSFISLANIDFPEKSPYRDDLIDFYHQLIYSPSFFNYRIVHFSGWIGYLEYLFALFK